MPVSLTTSFDPGSFDPGKAYGKIKVIEFTLDLYRFEFRMIIGRGYEESGKWVWARDSAGNILSSEHTIRDIETIPEQLDENGDPIPGSDKPADPQYSILVSKLVGNDPNKTIYDRAADEVYAWILANVVKYTGTVDP